MQENSNKAIFLNSLFLYAKLFVVIITTFLTTRFALQALGVTDFGLFSVLGSIISFIAIFNTIMLSASNRFISVAIGKGDPKEINEQFNINLAIHIGIALVTLLIAIPLGDWYIGAFVNFDGDISKAYDVFHFAIIGSIISFVGVPYNGLLMAKEKFLVFSLTDIATHIIKMIVAYSLIYFFQEKLLIYAFSQAALTGITTLVYFLYCKSKYTDFVRFKLSRNKAKYLEVFSFSGWVTYGAVATVGRNQGAALLVNAFFNTAMNAALGLANTVCSMVLQFANNISHPMAPQITKNYASGNMERCNELLIMSTKFTFLVMLCIASPFLLNAQCIFSLWLGNVPEYVVSFTILLIIDLLVQSLNSGISVIIFASGKIRFYQVAINTIRLLAIGAAYIVLNIGFPPESLFFTYIAFSLLLFMVGQYSLRRELNYNTTQLWRKSYIPSVICTILFLPMLLSSRLGIYPLIQIAIGMLYLLAIIYWVGLSREERAYIQKMILSKIHK